MKRRTITYILIMAMAVAMLISGCGNKQNDTEKNSEVVSGTETENISEMETEKGTETQTSSETESETQVATNDNTEDESDKKDEDSKDDGKKDEDDKKDEESNKPSEPEKPVHTCNFATLKTDANNHWYACSCGNTSGKGGHGYDDEYDASCNTCGYTRSVPERPAPPSDEKESIKFTGGTITLPTTGVTIPTLPHFNTAGMQPGGDIWWDGPESAGNAGMNSIYNTCEKFTTKLKELGKIGNDSSNFTAGRNLIEWNWLGAGMAGDFELYRGTEYYTLTINCSLKDFTNGAGEQLAPYNRDILLVLCSIVSGTPEKLSDYIYGCLYGDSNVYPIYDSKYITVGDCQLKMDPYFTTSSSGSTHFKFYIMPND